MKQDRSLYVGFDLGRTYSQISCYDVKSDKIVTICQNKEMVDGLIPTLLGVTKEQREWVFGTEAKQLNEDDGILIDQILERIIRKEKFHVFGVLFTGEDILEKYFRKTLLLLKRYYPSESIKKIVVTIKEKKTVLVEAIFHALEQLGIEKDRVAVEGYEESYISYALGQERELWINDIGLFELDEEGLSYRQLILNRRTNPMIVEVWKKEFYDTLNLPMIKEQEKTKTTEKNEFLFLNTAKNVLYKQGVSTIYVTGIGFLGEWADKALKELCVGRRVFKGPNLYTKGACLQAMKLGGIKQYEEYAFIGKGAIKANVMLPVYHDAKEEMLILAKVGTLWNEVNNEADIILDNEDEIQIIVNDPMKKETKTHILEMDGLPVRANKMTRIKIKISFLDEKTAVITLKDDGFGIFSETSNRVWEKTIIV
ncbi:DUF5716 family protein [Velocimicrobium porci]|uniref:DUF5716 domain-containing protein n=1 Tax=Velocimicrobium porci TaxID=2606634 RepID=A0A6L5XY21_9FIRM|nr:DUF5716 family protein [Velocimicrobium porci]MSS63509.1 hypothetical protein [Velocimicrobium porci]